MKFILYILLTYVSCRVITTTLTGNRHDEDTTTTTTTTLTGNRHDEDTTTTTDLLNNRKRDFITNELYIADNEQGDQTNIQFIKYHNRIFSIWMDSINDAGSPCILGRFIDMINNTSTNTNVNSTINVTVSGIVNGTDNINYSTVFQVSKRNGFVPIQPKLIIVNNKLIACYIDYYSGIEFYNIICKLITSENYDDNVVIMGYGTNHNPDIQVLIVKNIYYNSTVYGECLGIHWKSTSIGDRMLNIYNDNLVQISSPFTTSISGPNLESQVLYYNNHLYMKGFNFASPSIIKPYTIFKMNMTGVLTNSITLNNITDDINYMSDVNMYIVNNSIIVSYIINTNITNTINSSYRIQEYDMNLMKVNKEFIWERNNNDTISTNTKLLYIESEDILVLYGTDMEDIDYSSRIVSKIIRLGNGNNMYDKLNNSTIIQENFVVNDYYINNQLNPNILQLDDNNLLYGWESINQSLWNSNIDLRMRIYQIIEPIIAISSSNSNSNINSNSNSNNSVSNINSNNSNINSITTSNINSNSDIITTNSNINSDSNSVITSILNSISSNNVDITGHMISIFNYDQTYYYDYGSFIITGGTGGYDNDVGGTIHIIFNSNNDYFDQTITLFEYSGLLSSYSNLQVEGVETCYEHDGEYYQIDTQTTTNAQGINVFQAVFTSLTCSSSDAIRINVF